MADQTEEPGGPEEQEEEGRAEEPSRRSEPILFTSNIGSLQDFGRTVSVQSTFDPANFPSAVYYSWGKVTEPSAREQSRLIFVGYPYRIPADDYRPVFAQVAEEYGVEFIFADEQLTNKHILEKIAGLMQSCDFSLFDITYWNPNVALELGVAYGSGWDYYILFDPTKEEEEVLSDLRGIDRIEYRTYAELRAKLATLVRDQYGAPEAEQRSAPGAGLVEQLETLKERVPELLRANPGQQMGGIASSLGLPVELAQTIVRPLVGTELETRGNRRAMRYYVMGDAPPEEANEPVGDDAEGGNETLTL